MPDHDHMRIDRPENVACLAAFSLRASVIIFNIRMGPPGEFIRIGKTDDNQSRH